MPTFKVIIFPHQKKEDGSYNVKVRVTQNRQSKYIKTSHYVSGSDISRKKENGKEKIRIKNQAVLDLMDEIIISYKKKLITAGPQAEYWDVDKIVSFLFNQPKIFVVDFIEYGRKYADTIEARGRTGTAKQYRIAINSLIRFIGRDKLDVNEITVSFLKAFEIYIENEPTYKGLRNGKSIATKIPKGGRAVSLYMSHIRTIFEMAKREYNDEENGVINIPLSPFSRYTIPPIVSSKHRTLTIEQIQSIINLPYKEVDKTGRFSLYNLSKDIFLMSFALMGINTADFYDSKSISGDVLIYNRKKTRTRRKDGAEIHVKIEPEIMPLYEKYRGKNNAFVFCEHYAKPDNFNKMINVGLKKIGNDIGVSGLNYYYARHSMASICANRLNIDIARVDEMLNHSDPKLALARVYIERDYKPLWEANRKLIDLFDWSFYEEKPSNTSSMIEER